MLIYTISLATFKRHTSEINKIQIFLGAVGPAAPLPRLLRLWFVVLSLKQMSIFLFAKSSPCWSRPMAWSLEMAVALTPFPDNFHFHNTDALLSRMNLPVTANDARTLSILHAQFLAMIASYVTPIISTIIYLTYFVE